MVLPPADEKFAAVPLQRRTASGLVATRLQRCCNMPPSATRVQSNATGTGTRSQHPAERAPSLAAVDSSPESIRFSAVDVWPHPRDGDCFYHAVGADAARHGATGPLDQAALRRLVKAACNSAQANEYRMGNGELLSTTLALENNRTLQWLGNRALKTGSRGWAGVEEAVVLANQLKMLINIYVKRPRCYELNAVARPVCGVPIGTIKEYHHG